MEAPSLNILAPFLPYELFYHSGSKDLLKEMEDKQCLRFSLVDVDMREVEDFCKAAAENDVWKQIFDGNDHCGIRATSHYDSDVFMDAVVRHIDLATHFPTAKIHHDASCTQDVVLLKSMYAHLQHPKGSGRMTFHGDGFIRGATCRTILSLGTSEKGKRMEFKEVTGSGKALEAGRSVCFKVPSGTVLTLNKEGSGANWKNGEWTEDELAMVHRPVNAQGTLSVITEWRPNCLKNITEEDACTAVHAGLPWVGDFPTIPMASHLHFPSVVNTSDAYRSRRRQKIRRLDMITTDLFHDMFAKVLVHSV